MKFIRPTERMKKIHSKVEIDNLVSRKRGSVALLVCLLLGALIYPISASENAGNKQISKIFGISGHPSAKMCGAKNFSPCPQRSRRSFRIVK